MNRALCLASIDADVNESKIEDVLAKVTLIHKKLEKQKDNIPIYPSRHVCNGTIKGKMIFLHLNIKHKSKTSSHYSKAVQWQIFHTYSGRCL
jgi:hypothetical protein